MKALGMHDKLYAVAMQCAKYNAHGCAMGCAGCQFNVYNYVDDVREASLLKATAYTDYHNQEEIYGKYEERAKVRTAAPYIIWIGLLLFILYQCAACYSFKNPTQNITDKETAAATLAQMFMNEAEARRTEGTIEEEATFLAWNPNTVTNVPRILRVIQRVGGPPDMNKDGNIDCIDYSCFFRYLYGSDARLIINTNASQKMNHMFIRVLYGKNNPPDFMDIEPQGTPDRYSMGLVWGVKYNTAYNRDVTAQWTHVVGGME